VADVGVNIEANIVPDVAAATAAPTPRAPAAEAKEERARGPIHRRYRIQDVLKEGQKILVQVVKEEGGFGLILDKEGVAHQWVAQELPEDVKWLPVKTITAK
jgi:hypothetical protein